MRGVDLLHGKGGKGRGRGLDRVILCFEVVDLGKLSTIPDAVMLDQGEKADVSCWPECNKPEFKSAGDV